MKRNKSGIFHIHFYAKLADAPAIYVYHSFFFVYMYIIIQKQ